MKPDSLDVKGYYDGKNKRCFAKVIMVISLPNGKTKTFIGKGDTIKYDGDVENEEYAIALASARAVREVYRQYIDFLLMYSHRFNSVKKPKKQPHEMTATEYAATKGKIDTGLDNLLGLIGGMANPIFTKGMMGK